MAELNNIESTEVVKEVKISNVRVINPPLVSHIEDARPSASVSIDNSADLVPKIENANTGG